MMKKTKMLKKNYEFKNVLSKGKYVSGNYLEAFYIKEKQVICNHLGIAISVKIAKAVKRNHIKRLIKESYQLLESEMTLGNTIVFLWKKKSSIENATFDKIKQDMLKILKKVDML